MTLLHIDGFDGRTAGLTGAYDALLLNTGAFGYTTGRFGTGLCIYGGGSNSGGEFRKNFGATKTTIYTGVSFTLSSAYNGFESFLFSFYSGGTEVLNLRVMPTNNSPPGRIRAYRQTDSTQLGIASSVPTAWVWTLIEMKVVCGTGTSGSLIVRMNGTDILNLSSISTGSTSVDAIALCYRDDLWLPLFQYDDWWVCDNSGTINNNFMGDMRILNLVPVGADRLPNSRPCWP